MMIQIQLERQVNVNTVDLLLISSAGSRLLMQAAVST